MHEKGLNQNERQIILSLSGGLGNQLWQLAFAYSIMKRFSYSSILLDHTYYRKHPEYIRKPELEAFLLSDQIFKLEESDKQPLEYRLYSSLFSKYRALYYRVHKTLPDNPFSFIYKKGYVITHNRIKHNIPQDKDTLWLNGFFENHKQIAEIFPDFRNLLVLNNPSSEFNKMMALISKAEKPVALSVRCGEDYIRAGRMFCTAEYYNTALGYFPDRDIYLFSDDPVRALEITGLKDRVHAIPLLTPPEQLILMSLCHDFILANSTFSYWGALLSACEDKKIVYPSQWLPWQKTEDAGILYAGNNIIIEV